MKSFLSTYRSIIFVALFGGCVVISLTGCEEIASALGGEYAVEGVVVDRGMEVGIEDATLTGVADGEKTLFETTTNNDGEYSTTFDVEEVPDELEVSVSASKFIPDDRTVSLEENLTVDFELQWSDPPVEESCTSFDPNNLVINPRSENVWWIHESGEMPVAAFQEEQDAEKALSIIQFYGFNDRCILGDSYWGNMEYWLVDRSPPVTDITPAVQEDCLSFNQDNIEIEQHDEGWLIVDGTQNMLIFDELAAAESAVDLIHFYEFTQFCFVGRPDGTKRYWRR